MNIVFVCYANSIRSQMAEGIARSLLPANQFTVMSAGFNSSSLHPIAAQCLREINIDISAQESKSLDELDVEIVDHAIVLVNETLPSLHFDVIHAHHWPTPDPTAGISFDPNQTMENFRRVREFLSRKILELKETLLNELKGEI